MYLEFLERLTLWIKTLNEMDKDLNEVEGLTPYLGEIPVMLDGVLCGHIVDEIGGVWSYRELQEH